MTQVIFLFIFFLIGNDENLQELWRNFNDYTYVTGLFQFAALLLRQQSQSLPGVSDPAEKLSQLPHHDLACSERRMVVTGGRRRGERGAFSLQQALFSPHSPGHHTPAGTHLIMHPVWRQGQNGPQKRSLKSFGDYLFHNKSIKS